MPKDRSIVVGLVVFLALGAAARVRAGELAGRQLLVTSVRTGDTEVFLVDPETGDARNLSRSPKSEDRYPAWSPDGRQVAFISDRDGPANLYVMDAEGGNVRRLTRTPAVCYMPSWVGDVIVFGMHGEKPEIASIRPDGSGLRVVGDGHDPTLSPDGRTIAFTGDVEGGFAVFAMDADGASRRRVVRDTNPLGAVFPSFSPDGGEIVYSGAVGSALELFVVAAAGGEPRQLTRLGKVATPAAWSPDGRFISFRLTDEMYWRDKERMRQVYAEKPADKRPVWVMRPDGSGAHVVETLRYQCAIDGSRAAWRPGTAAGFWSASRATFRPGEPWPDDKGVHVNAHGGGILDHGGRYYWFGEHKVDVSGTPRPGSSRAGRRFRRAPSALRASRSRPPARRRGRRSGRRRARC